MITSRKERVQVAIELLQSVQQDEASDCLRAQQQGLDWDLVEGMCSNSELLVDAIDLLRQVR